MLRLIFAVLAGLTCLTIGTPGVFARARIDLSPYLAEYDLTLEGSSSGMDIAGVDGRIVLEFAGASCTGYTNDSRIVTAIETFEGDRLITDVRTKTTEFPDGRLEFFNETYAQGTRVERVVGTAHKEGEERLRVVLSEPREETVMVSGPIVFPTEQVVDVLKAALAGKPFVAMDVYDGSQEGVLVYQTAAVIGPPRTGDPTGADDDLIASEVFDGMTNWPVTISYFEKSAAHADATPDIVMSFDLFENGIGRRFLIDYGDFALAGSLTRLEMLPRTECE